MVLQIRSQKGGTTKKKNKEVIGLMEDEQGRKMI